MKKYVFATCLIGLLAAAPALAQVDLSNYVALGDSLTAGFSSGSLLDYYQERSYPAVLAAQAGVTDFELPLVSEPGLPPILELVHLVPTPVIQPVGLVPGIPLNAELPRPYNNLAVPGADLYDMLFATGDIYNLLAGNTDNVMNDLILRDGIHTALEQAIGLQPTFITVWIGNNDILPAWASGTPIEGVTMTPVDAFETMYNNAIGALVTNTSADIVLINLPYGTRIPFTTTVPPMVDIPGVGTIPLEGTNGPLTADCLVTLPASSLIAMGYGLPGGPPLPEDLNPLTGEPGYVLRPEQIAAIEAQTDAYNEIIADTAAALGLPVLDVNSSFAAIAGGESWDLGGVELNGDFLVGGLFSYDGIHGQNIGYARVAYELIDLINEEFGADIPQVDMATVMFEGDWQTADGGKSAAKKVTMSPEAFKQLLEVLAPDLKRAPTVRGPDARRPQRAAPDLRRRPHIDQTP